MLPVTTKRYRPTDLPDQVKFGPDKERTTSTSDDPLDWMTAILDGKRMRIHLGGRDRTGMILYLSRLVFEHGLSIQESSVTRLQDQSGSFFIVTGPLERLGELSDRIKEEGGRTLEGEVISPYKILDLAINVPDRNGLILDVCTLLKDYKVNIKSMTSFIYPDLDDVSWARIQTRIEVTRERFADMDRMEREIDAMCRTTLEGQFDQKSGQHDLNGWLVSLRERLGGGMESP